MSATTRPWIRRQRVEPSAPRLPVVGYALAIAFWIALAALGGIRSGRTIDAITTMMLGPLNGFIHWRFDPARIEFDRTPDFDMFGVYLGFVLFWLLQSLLRNSASPFLRAILLRALGYAHIFAWGCMGMVYLGLRFGH